MSKTTLRGASNEIIGYQVDRPEEIVLYNENNSIAGRYLKNMDTTHAANGKLVGRGNILLTLLD